MRGTEPSVAILAGGLFFRVASGKRSSLIFFSPVYAGAIGDFSFLAIV